jgi:hypothetical protein
MGSRFVALLVAVIGVIALAAAGVYLYRHQGAAPRVEDKAAEGEKPGEQPKPGESQPAETAPSKPTSVPSFDVVRIEPTGEGVIAGRAQPGWTITLESGGNKIAETKADEEGAWSVVLDKPLAAGDHSLALRATSPDGTQALTGQQPVQVAVSKPGEAVVAQKEPAAPEPTREAAPAVPEEPKTAEAPQAVPGQPEPVVPDENAPPPERPKPPVRIGKLDYQDTATDSGKISMSGVGDPNARVLFFFDDQPLGEVVIGGDGTWAFEIEKKLGEGEHNIRADTYDAKTGVVAGRASLRLGREPRPAGPKSRAQEDSPAGSRQSSPPRCAAQAGQPSPPPVYPDGPPERRPPSTSLPRRSALSRHQPDRKERQVRRRVQPLAREPRNSPSSHLSRFTRREGRQRLSRSPVSLRAAPAEPSAPVVPERKRRKLTPADKGAGSVQSVDYQGYWQQVRKGLAFRHRRARRAVFPYFLRDAAREVRRRQPRNLRSRP